LYLKLGFKGPVLRFSQQVVMNKCFLLDPEKNLLQISAVIFEKNVKPLNPDALQFRKNDVTVPQATLITSKGKFRHLFASLMSLF